jgi:type II secretory pathway component PulJ
MKAPPRRGLSMIETLLALALLAAIVAASASWTAMASRVAAQATEPAQREAVVETLFGLIHEDLVSGDFDPEARRAREQAIHERARTQDNELEIQGRGSTKHTYRLDRSAHRLERVERSRNDVESRRLLEGVTQFTCVLDVQRQVLDVSIDLTLRAGEESTTTLTRRYRLL